MNYAATNIRKKTYMSFGKNDFENQLDHVTGVELVRVGRIGTDSQPFRIEHDPRLNMLNANDSTMKATIAKHDAHGPIGQILFPCP